MVIRERKKTVKKAAMREKGKNLSVLGVTVLTVSFKQKIITKCCRNYISTGKAGVAFSLKRDTKKSIRGKTKEKKNQDKGNFTMRSQICEETVKLVGAFASTQTTKGRLNKE
jgi:hypothetical protein